MGPAESDQEAIETPLGGPPYLRITLAVCAAAVAIAHAIAAVAG